jgi:hypothetical protein
MGFIVTTSQRACEQIFALLFVAPQLVAENALGNGSATEPARVAAGKAKIVATNPAIPNSTSGDIRALRLSGWHSAVNRRIK